MTEKRFGRALGISAAILTALPPSLTAAQDVPQATQMLASANRDEVEAGIQSLGLVGTAAAVDPLIARIKKGLPPDLLETALFTLMALGQPSAGPLLVELSTHRRPEVRLRAVEAIAAIKPPGAEGALLSALSDSHPKVRSAAASALGEVGAHDAIEVLFHALDRGNLEASPAIGKVVKSDQAPRLLDYVGKVPFRSLGPALAEVLKRKDITDDIKLSVVGRLQEVATPEVKAFLGDLLATAADAGVSPRLVKAMLGAMQQIAD
jgi:HEAT repeat protein